MKITVLQGLNLENPGTTIKIELDSPTSTKILEKIKSFHPVFMDEYKIDGKTITIHSKLSHLWIEIGKALNSFSKKDWSEEYTEKYILEEVIKKQILSMSSIPILYEAMQQKLEITQYYVQEGLVSGFGENKYNRYYVLGSGVESNISISIASSKDANIAKQTQEDKWLTNTVIDRLKLPTAKWQLLESKDEIEEVWDKYKKPVVIKPTGLTGGNGVVTNINTIQQAFDAFAVADNMIKAKERSSWQTKIMIQEQAEGKDYRILIIDGKFAIATKRIPANVIGDGAKNIKELINETNKDPRRDKSLPTHILKPIEIDDQLITFLNEQGLDIDYVPKKDQQIFVRKVASMSKGGITEDFTDKVHPQIKLICESLASSIHAYVLGVDVLCKDISQPLTPENGIIIECNTMPEAYLNAFPIIGKQYPHIGKMYLSGLIGKDRTKRVVYVGGSTQDVFTHLKTIVEQTETIGLYSQNNIYINQELITSNVETRKAVEALKINASLTTIALHYQNIKEIEEHGLGFEEIDLVVLEKNVDEKVEKTVRGYKNLGLIFKVEKL